MIMREFPSRVVLLEELTTWELQGGYSAYDHFVGVGFFVQDPRDGRVYAAVAWAVHHAISNHPGITVSDMFFVPW
jgi:hypothetical protein